MEARFTEEGGTLKERVTLNAKKLASAQKAGKTTYVEGFVKNLYGAYTENVIAQRFIQNGATVVHSLSHINKPGPDLVALSENTAYIVEAKAVKNNLALSQLNNYIKPDEVTGALKFNINYAVNKLGDSYFMDSPFSKKLVFYINSPESSSIGNNLISQLGGISQIPYSYKDPETQRIISGTVEIIIEAVNK